MRINELKRQIEQVLADVPESRNSDITLTIEIWKRFYPQRIRTNAQGREGIFLDDLYDLPREDHIKRIRATFQKDKTQPRYLPTEPAVAKQRRINEDVWKKHLNYMPPRKPRYEFDPVRKVMKVV